MFEVLSPLVEVLTSYNIIELSANDQLLVKIRNT